MLKICPAVAVLVLVGSENNCAVVAPILDVSTFPVVLIKDAPLSTPLHVKAPVFVIDACNVPKTHSVNVLNIFSAVP